MRNEKVVFLCPSFSTYWVQIFDAFHSRLGGNFTVITQSFNDAFNARVAQTMGAFHRKIILGFRLSLSARKPEAGLGTPFGLNIAPFLPWTLRRLAPRVVIANNFGVWALAALLMRYPTVIFWEGTEHTERTVQPWRKRLRIWMAQKAGAFVVNGTSAREYLVETLGVAQDRVFVGSLCCEPPPSGIGDSRRQNDNPARPRNILFVGRLIKGKGVDHLLHAAAQLRLMAPKDEAIFRVTVVGDGPERNTLESLAEDLEIRDLVTFTGAVHPHEIWAYYGNADIFVLPTLHDNWPLVVLEAMSVGLPVLLSSYAGSLPDLVHHGVNGYGFEPDDHHALAMLIRGYIENSEKIVDHGTNSLNISMQYSPERAVNAFMNAATLAQRDADFLAET